ncbi:FAD-dependent oxidoreductase [Winogradskyella maritima]|uniref:FAD-dependent oxidoreductase n=1 Tax=Winogradskyella maritima TaxID=1517766 RepID=A0ABV8AFT8_9FLAO|nr:FAD-dependent oxidoreductase [Winogradskyella maritima]
MKDPRFPELSYRQINKLKSYGEVETYEKDAYVFKIGDNTYDFFAILEGEIHIEDPYNDTIIVKHGKYEFSGDSGMLSERSAQFHAVAKAGSTLLRIKPKQLKEAISKNSDISDILLNAFLLRQETVLNEMSGGMKLLGSEKSNKTYEIRDFLEKNHIWYNFLDVDSSQEAKDLLAHFDLSQDDLPLLINSESKVCKNPSLEELGRYSGVLMDFEDKIFDVLVIGAGPAGLAASVYAASEGLEVVTIDSEAPGGQAGKSSKIENYLGFPTGISGGDLANRAYVQAQKFGCNISIPHRAKSLERHDGYFTVCATNDKVIKSKAIIIATGADYRQLPIDNINDYEGSGVYYSATGMDVSHCKDEEVVIVGGGNSAGQAAMFLSGFADKVHVMIRGNNLGAKMSDYLVQRLEDSDVIEIHKETEITKLNGNHYLESIEVSCKDNTNEMPISNVFSFIGAKPNTKWLEDNVVTDERGFICTGPNLQPKDLETCHIYKNRKPQSLESSVAGIFAVGDARNGSVKRVASAVGEGSMAVSQVHTYLSELNNKL